MVVTNKICDFWQIKVLNLCLVFYGNNGSMYVENFS